MSLRQLAFNAIPMTDSQYAFEIDEASKGLPNRSPKIERLILNNILDKVHEVQKENGYEEDDSIIRFRTNINGKQYSVLDVINDTNYIDEFMGNYLEQYPRRRRFEGYGKSKSNNWINHVKAFAKKYKIPYKDAMCDPKCKLSYKK
jgi:hypothetical protein